MLTNIAGIRLVAISSPLWLFFNPFRRPSPLIVILAPFKAGALTGTVTAPVTSTIGLVGGILIAMWNYMGWDSASTIATEVHHPQKTYPRAMLLAVLIVSLTYILPVLAMRITGVSSSAFETGSWANLAGLVGGRWLQIVLVFGGLVSLTFGMLNALVMSYCRLPLAMAQDRMLPAAFAKLHQKTRAPWVAILACGAGWALCVGLGFERLVTLDVLLSGASVVLEFAALIALRIREPELDRPFRVPGGMWGASLVGVFPLLLLGFSVVSSANERVWGLNGLALGALLIAAGFLAYWAKPAPPAEAALATAPPES